ncbi:MAG TPA: EboA domain-containing protein [Polyangiaceae bacterium]|jgi:hypothetical protein|nr:EboA domain-containing protein [Polyangiaceae bacterium]
MSDRATVLAELVRQRCPECSSWFERAWANASAPLGMSFRAALASAPRRLGARASEPVEAPPALASLVRPHWTLVDYVRAALVLRALELLPAGEHATTVLKLFEAGEIGEQVSVLRTLGLLPEPERFVQTGLQACRTNAKDVFEALVCENPYLAAYFPELGFNQAVMKAIFMEVSVRRIEGLEPRITPELKRMATDYTSERRAAGRPVPEDASYIVSY